MYCTRNTFIVGNKFEKEKVLIGLQVNLIDLRARHYACVDLDLADRVSMHCNKKNRT
jgi:hypothetical protein